ncbi:tetratricopeptide repeat protein [Clostridium ganghwense]|uniref:Tetratricopeptide repeat protein n=1 Tax=Clostridium ganghwense TaxID=312089 RepID=A0ABT4CUB6_9CLOT|nr:tetratricopeptide repeat protein [Clostridium ganghwense]MCY6372650.1 tetratricopeptide repeat protein [Clostridium ganghwense]
MFDFDLEIKKIRPINLKDMELNQYRINDNIIKSIILYNKSIAEVKANNLDLAIKDLKKALSYNRSFSEAVRLLGLCYVNKKAYRRAEKTFKKLAKYEIYSDLAKEYLKNLIIERTMYKTMDAIKRVKAGSNNKKNQFILTQYLRGKIIIGLSILIIVMVGFIVSYGGPSNLQTVWKKTQATNKVVDSEKKTDKNSEENKILSEKNTISHEDYENMQKKLEDTKLELDNYKNKYDILTMLNEVEKSFKDGNYEKAAGTLINMKNMNFDDETKIKFDKLWANIKTNALWTIYNQGNRLYKQAKYKEALPKLKIASEIDSNLDIMPWITYQIGVCYKETNDNTNALVYFQKIKDNYPKSNYASSAERMINQIGNKKNNVIVNKQ